MNPDPYPPEISTYLNAVAPQIGGEVTWVQSSNSVYRNFSKTGKDLPSYTTQKALFMLIPLQVIGWEIPLQTLNLWSTLVYVYDFLFSSRELTPFYVQIRTIIYDGDAVNISLTQIKYAARVTEWFYLGLHLKLGWCRGHGTYSIVCFMFILSDITLSGG